MKDALVVVGVSLYVLWEYWIPKTIISLLSTWKIAQDVSNVKSNVQKLLLKFKRCKEVAVSKGERLASGIPISSRHSVGGSET